MCPLAAPPPHPQLFGPLSISKLKEDKFERVVDGFLPTAKLAFIDEIFKANSAILNSMLTIINERLFSNGTSLLEVPLRSVIGASNEVPGQGHHELQALYDRFLVRIEVDYLPRAGKDGPGALFRQMILAPDAPSAAKSPKDGALLLHDFHHVDPRAKPPASDLISEAQLEQLHDDAKAVEITSDIVDILETLREKFSGDKWRNSDRRWKKMVKLLRIAAKTNGRDEVRPLDVLNLCHCLWHQPKQRPEVVKEVLATIATVGQSAAKVSKWRTFAAKHVQKAVDDVYTVEACDEIIAESDRRMEEIQKTLQKMTGEVQRDKDLVEEDIWLSETLKVEFVEALEAGQKNLQEILQKFSAAKELAEQAKTRPKVFSRQSDIMDRATQDLLATQILPAVTGKTAKSMSLTHAYTASKSKWGNGWMGISGDVLIVYKGSNSAIFCFLVRDVQSLGTNQSGKYGDSSGSILFGVQHGSLDLTNMKTGYMYSTEPPLWTQTGSWNKHLPVPAYVNQSGQGTKLSPHQYFNSSYNYWLFPNGGRGRFDAWTGSNSIDVSNFEVWRFK